MNELKRPFAPDDISWLPGATTKDGAKVQAMGRDLEDMLAGRTKPTITWSDADQEACDNERLGGERGWW